MKTLFLVTLFFMTQSYADPFNRILGSNTPSTELPKWVHDNKDTKIHAVVVMHSEEYKSKEDALNNAWWNSIARMGMIHFPEVMDITHTTKESLTESNFERSSNFNFNHINWDGIKEHEDSPLILFDKDKGTFKSIRRIEWSKDLIKKAKLGIRSMKNYALPSAPEIRTRETAEALQKLSEIQTEHNKESHKIRTVLKNLYCGISVGELSEILGPPDENYYVILDENQRSHHWKNFIVQSRYNMVVSYTDNPESKWVTVVCPRK